MHIGEVGLGEVGLDEGSWGACGGWMRVEKCTWTEDGKGTVETGGGDYWQVRLNGGPRFVLSSM